MSQLGLGLNLSKTKGGVVPFNPLSLDPYLLFDTQSSMIGTFENPTLDLDPSKPDTLNVITATRSGVATYTDAAGNIATASPNTVRVDYTQGAELTPTKFQRIGYTDFSSGVTLDGVTKTNQSTPYGDGILLTQDTSSGEHNMLVSVTNTGQHTFSLKVKPDGVTKLSLSLEYSTSNSEVVYDTVAETAGIQGSNVSDASIENLGDGWFLLKLTNDSAVSTARIRLRDNSSQVNYLGDGASGLFLANPQVEEGTTASSFVANTTGSPKFITGATYADRVPMILVEPSSENLVTNTDFSGWAQASSTTLTDGSGYAGQPSKIFTASAGTHRIFHTPTFATTAGTTYTGSIWIRRVSGTGTIQLNHQYSAQGNLTAITDDISEEWTRVEVDFTGHASSGDMWFGVWINVQGDSVEIAMPQVEVGAVATSFIPTSGSTVTRAADDLVISGSDFDFFNNSEGTFYVEYQFNDADGANSLIYGSADNQRFAYKNLGSFSPLLSYDGVNVLNYGRLSAGTLLRTALSFDSNSMEGSQDGSAATMSGQTAPFPHNGNLLSATELNIGSNTTGALHLNGHIKRLIYWPYHSDSL